ncbi:MAG: fibronectin type III domain-containing protein [[Eubacterium] siraeum]
MIRCTSTGKVLSAGSDNNVTAVSYNGSNNQLWKFYKNSDNYYKIVNVGTGKRLDVNNAGTADGTNIQVWTDNDSSAQRWGVYGSQGSYLLKPKYSTSSVLDSGGGNDNVHLWTYASNIAAQKFTIEKMPSTWFSDVTAKNIKTNDARIALYANKPASAKATKYSIEVWQTNNSSNKKSYSFTPSGNYPNEGVESKQIYFDMIAEVGFTLSSATQYSYKITQYFTYLGASMSRTSGTYSFTTLASSSHTHSYGSWYTKTSATCTSGGTEERKCSCGATESRSTSALGHNYGSTYFEAYHPHKYAHLCQRCGYKEFTGGNLDYYEKCDTCYNENLPGKPYLNISSNGFTESDTVSFTWDPTDKTTHYNLTVAVLSDGEYKTVCRQTYVNSGFQATFGKGQYRVVLDSYNSNMFHQYTDDWRDWIHNSSDYVYFDIDCAHEYESTIVKPTFTEKGYTLHKCTKCGYSYKDNYTPALKPTELTGVKVKTHGTASLTLAWDKNANAKGYIIEQYKGGKWTQIAKTSSNTAVTYTVNGLAADTTYTFRIKAYVISGESEIYSGYVRIAGKTRIANVASFKGSAVSASAVKLDWSKNDKATGYVIEQYKGGKWTAIATTKNNTTLTFTVKGLAKGTAYSFRIKSFRKTGSTTDFSEYTAIKAATLLDSVSDFKVTSVTGSWITLEWAKNDKATGYSIEQYKGGKWTVIATTKNNTTLKFTVKGLKNDTTYSFRIRAYKTAGASNVYSDYVRIAGKTRIPNVAKFTGSAVSASAVKLDWSKNDKATGYVIEQYKGGKWTAIATTKNNTTLTFTVKGLAKGTTYSFRIKSFRKTGSTIEFSEYASVKVKTAE